MTHTPLVSILMPVYNCGHYVKVAIDAILAQTFTDYEFIIINDGSTDNSKDVILSYKDERIKYYENEKNIGIIKTLNRGLQLASGQFILRTDADDIAMSDMAEKLVSFMQSNDDYIVCGTNITFFNDDDYKVAGGDVSLISVGEVSEFPSENDKLKIYSLRFSPFCHSAVIYRKDVLFRENIFYNDGLTYCEDYGLWSALLPYGKFKTFREIGLLYRKNPNQINARKDFHDHFVSSTHKIFMSHAMDYFGLNVNEAELYKVLIVPQRWEHEINIQSLDKIGAVMAKIILHNAQRRLFDPVLLKAFLFMKWHNLCQRSYRFGKKVFWIYAKHLMKTGNYLKVRSYPAHIRLLFTAAGK